MLEEILPAPPATAASESTRRMRSLFGIFPCESINPDSCPIAVTVPTDTNVYYGRITEDGNIRVSETFSNRITEQGDNKVIDLEIEYTFEDGTIDTYNNYIIQEQ